MWQPGSGGWREGLEATWGLPGETAWNVGPQAQECRSEWFEVPAPHHEPPHPEADFCATPEEAPRREPSGPQTVVMVMQLLLLQAHLCLECAWLQTRGP